MIDQDLHRTFPGHQTVDSTEGKDALRRVLVSYANRNRDVGYCQSMNFIAASLLIVQKDEESAFWSLALLEERILKEYHSRHMLGCRTDCRLLMKLCAEYLPKVTQYTLAAIPAHNLIQGHRLTHCLGVSHRPTTFS